MRNPVRLLISVSIRNAQVLALAAMVCAAMLLFPHAHAQTYTVLHNFTGGRDGGDPYAGLTMDRAGNLYGTASYGGNGYGVVYELAHRGSGWVFNSLYNFAGGNDGEGPVARVIIGPNGSLYGTTYGGGDPNCSGGYGCGTVFNLRPPATVCRSVSCYWSETVLYRFAGGNDGANPLLGDILFDPTGNIYGTTENGGDVGCDGMGCGTVFELSPSGGGWIEKVLYSFMGQSGDGANPFAGVILDSTGNLYGTTKFGGPLSEGTVFKLSPAGSSWTESVIYGFEGTNDGYWPVGGLIIDHSGNLVGTTGSGGVNAGGIAFNLTPLGAEAIVHSFDGQQDGGAYGTLTADAAGNFYGMTYDDGAYGNGSVFKLTPTQGGWIYTDLHDFTGDDGRCPYGNVVIDAQGNLYGTAGGGGTYDEGVVWEITP